MSVKITSISTSQDQDYALIFFNSEYWEFNEAANKVWFDEISQEDENICKNTNDQDQLKEILEPLINDKFIREARQAEYEYQIK